MSFRICGSTGMPVFFFPVISTAFQHTFATKIRENNRFWGRGIEDTKACVATQINAVEELLDVWWRHGRVVQHFYWFLARNLMESTRGEWMNCNWVGRLSFWGNLPYRLRFWSLHKGAVGLTVKAMGKCGHGLYPWRAENADWILILALMLLDQFKETKFGKVWTVGIQSPVSGKIWWGYWVKCCSPARKRVSTDPVYLDCDIEGFHIRTVFLHPQGTFHILFYVSEFETITDD